MKGSTKKTETNETQSYDVKVTRAKEVKEGNVTFDMVVNGVTIYGCWYHEGTNEKTGKEYELIDFPSHKSKDGKYYHECYFKIDQTVKEDIIEQLRKLV